VIHTVVRGETLTSIARKYGVEPRQIAAWNNLSPPYRLSRGQKLRLAPASAKRPPAVSGTPSVKPPARPGGSGKAIWSWPAQGALLERYKPNAAMKGIDIGGKKGQPVHAAGEGQVVYQGSGLRGYGQLIILKHDADYLSAYAHCDRILVKEGDMIKRGQKIAEMGASGTDRVKLHFEIRYRGAPVDPLSHLPRR
jgi:lipoprotein NlpD